MRRIQLLIAFALCLILWTCEPVFAGNVEVRTPTQLQTALNGGVLAPGDTLYLHGATYMGTFVSRLNGTAFKPVVVRSYPGEWAKIDGAAGPDDILTVSGTYTWFWGFEIMTSDPRKISTQDTDWPTDVSGSTAVSIAQDGNSGTGCKFINLVVHDARQGFSLWKDAQDLEVYGCVIYYNGWRPPNKPGAGHGIYTQNQSGHKYLRDNIVWSNFSHGIHAYGTEVAPLNGYVLSGNVVVGHSNERDILLGGGALLDGADIAFNCVYDPPGVGMVLGYTTGPGAMRCNVIDNYIVGALKLNRVTASTLTRNIVNGAMESVGSDSYSGNTVVAFPNHPASRVFIRPDQYTPGRAIVTIYNWENASTVNVDISSIMPSGATYQVIDGQNPTGPAVLTGTYSGGMVAFPMTLAAIAPKIGNDPRTLSHTPREFGVFILLGGGGGELAVTLTSFTADPIGKNVLLNWSTASEINNFGFWVERTSDSAFAVLPGSFQAGYGTTTVPHSYSFVDSTASGKVTYRLKQQDLSGAVHYPGSPITVTLTGVERTNAAPTGYTLFQNYPNPFNSETHIYFSITSTERTTLKLYDTLGRVIRTLFEGTLGPGEYGYILSSEGLSTGVYIYRLQSGNFSAAKAMVVLK